MNRLMLCEYPEILTVDDIKKILRVGRNKAYSLVKNEIPFFKLGKIYCISKKDFLEYIDKK